MKEIFSNTHRLKWGSVVLDREASKTKVTNIVKKSIRKKRSPFQIISSPPPLIVMVMVEGGAVPRFFPCATYVTETVSSPLVAKN